MSGDLTALDVIVEAIPVDWADGCTIHKVDADGMCVWGPPETVATRIHDALVDAGYLIADKS